jgi:hypothetical protein
MSMEINLSGRQGRNNVLDTFWVKLGEWEWELF